MTSRALTAGEIDLARGVFGDAIDYAPVRLNRRKWAFFQPRGTVMAPDGQIWFHPLCDRWSDDFSAERVDVQGLLIHELTHVWQRQCGIYLPLARHAFCRYSYAFKPGRPFQRYGIEQQACIVEDVFRARAKGDAATLARLAPIVPFPGWR